MTWTVCGISTQKFCVLDFWCSCICLKVVLWECYVKKPPHFQKIRSRRLRVRFPRNFGFQTHWEVILCWFRSFLDAWLKNALWRMLSEMLRISMYPLRNPPGSKSPWYDGFSWVLLLFTGYFRTFVQVFISNFSILNPCSLVILEFWWW